MNRSLFISFDGPKGTGKTTVLRAVHEALAADQNCELFSFCEKDLDPLRADTLALLQELAASPSAALELLVCERLAAGRAWITENVLADIEPTTVILIDRWYPSDAAFRRSIPFQQVLDLNLTRGVRVPDLHVGVVVPPAMSWARAAARPRGLNSVVIRSYEEHQSCSQAFDMAIDSQGWFGCHNDGPVENAVALIIEKIRQIRG